MWKIVVRDINGQTSGDMSEEHVVREFVTQENPKLLQMRGVSFMDEGMHQHIYLPSNTESLEIYEQK